MEGYGMKPMTRTRLILFGLVAVHLLLNGCVGVVGLFYLAVSPFFPTQGVLLGLWIAMGRRWAIPWRACLGIVIVAATFPVPVFGMFDVTLLWEMWFIALALLVMRIAGLRMIHVDVPATTTGPFQFSLLEILSWMTATAVFLALLKMTAQFSLLEVLSMPLTSIDELALLATSVVLALPAMWLVFGRRWLQQRCLGCMGAVAVASVAFAAIRTAANPIVPVGTITLVKAFLFSVLTAWLIACFLVIRWAGYRLEWRWRFSRRQSHAPTG
jgi:hypothetical protein